MLKKTIILLCLVLCFTSKAQNWASLDTGIHSSLVVHFPYGLMADNVHNNLFAFGSEYPSTYFPAGFSGVTVWNNTINKWQHWYPNIAWSSYGNEMVMFNNKMLFFYPFYENNDNSKPRTCILQFSNNIDLDTLKILQNQDWLPNRDCIYNGKMILDNINWMAPNEHSIATFDGDTIIPIGDTIISDITNACVFNNELYGCGILANGKHAVVKKTLSGWTSMFQIQGGVSSLGGLIVYNNRLYVFGSFSETENSNNFGHCIVAYDGVNWDKLGGGTTSTFGYAYEQILDVAECSGKLYVCGKYTHAGSMPVNTLLTWDDHEWCSIGSDLDSIGVIQRIECLNDTIFAFAGFNKYYGNDYGMVAKLKAMHYSDTCTSSFVGLEELKTFDNVKIYPNPTTSIINIVDENNQLQNTTIQIQNYFGQLVFSSPFNSQIDLRSLSAGMYFLTIEDKGNKKTIKLVKQ
jgi:hypothetical protein